MKHNLKKRSLRGGAITLGARASSFFLQLGSTAILARMLSPEDFGLIAMVMVVTNFFLLLKDIGLSDATIQKDQINHDQISTLFWINLLICFILMLLTAAMAPLISWFYNDPRLTRITIILAFVFFINGFIIQHQALLIRQMYFGALAAIEIVSTLFGLAAAIISAWFGAGYWALVLNILTRETIAAFGYWMTCKWHPGLPVRNSGVRKMLSYGGHVSGFNIINYFARNLDNILIGHFCGSAPLGFYSKAYQIVMLPIVNIRGPLNAVAMPSLSRLQAEPIKYKNYYINLVTLFSQISMPIIVFSFVCSKDLILLIFGEQWIAMNNIFKMLAVASFIQPVATTSGLVLLSLGQTKRYLMFGVFSTFIRIISFSIGIRWGVIGVATAYVMSEYILLLPSLWYCFRMSPIAIINFFSSIWRSAIASLAMGTAIFLILQYMVDQIPIIEIMISFAVGLFAYILISLILPGGLEKMHELYDYFRIIFPLKKKFNR